MAKKKVVPKSRSTQPVAKTKISSRQVAAARAIAPPRKRQPSVQDQIADIQQQFSIVLRALNVGSHELSKAERDLFDPPVPGEGSELFSDTPDFTQEIGGWGTDASGKPAIGGVVNEHENTLSMMGRMAAQIEVISQRQKAQTQDILELKNRVAHKEQGARMR